MPVRVDIPTRLKVDVPALSERRGDIEEAIAAAVGRALRASAGEVLEPRGGYVGVRLNEPELSWWGDGLAGVSPTVRADVEEAVRAAVAGAAADAGLPPMAGEGASTPLRKPPAVPIDDPRYDPFFGLYELPVYDAAGKKTKVPVRRPAAKDHPRFPDPIFQWYPMSSREALDVYLSAAQGANQPPAQGYMGAIYTDREYGLTINVVEYPSTENVFRASGLHLLRYDDYGVSGDPVLTPVKRLPPVSRYLLDFIGTKNSADFEPRVRALFKPQIRFFMATRKVDVVSEKEFKDDLERRLKAVVEEARKQKGVGANTVFMHLQVHWESFLLILQPSEDRGTPKPDMQRVRLIPLVRPAEAGGTGGKGRGGAGRGRGPGGEGRGAEGTAAEPGEARGEEGAGLGGERARRGGVEGGIAGGKPSEGPPAFVDIGGSPTAASLFPPASAAMERVELVCAPFEGEPSMGQLGADGNRMRKKVEQIAYRLQIPTCEFAGQFLLNAAEALGGRATQVALWEVTDTGGMKSTPAGEGNLGAVQFIPTAGPQILFLRHLASTVPFMTELKREIDRVYRERSDLLGGYYTGNAESWMNRWHYAYVVEGMERHVGLMFVMTCHVIFMQLLNTSRENIRARNNPGWAEHFIGAVLPQLMLIDELLRARELVDRADAIAAVLRFGPDHVRSLYRDVTIADAVPAQEEPGPAPNTWQEATQAVEQALAPPPAADEKPIHTLYALLPQKGGTWRIRDKRGRIWDKKGLEMAIALHRGTIEEVEPLVKQFTDLPEVVERLRDLPDGGMKYELHLIITEMLEDNLEVTDKAKRNQWFAFRATTIRENIRTPTVAGSKYQLEGIHKQAHQEVGEFFRGDPFYRLGINALFAGELGRKQLAAAIEFAGLVLLSVVCPPVAAGVGLGAAIHHYGEAKQREQVYNALIDPEKVLTAAEVEMALFAAQLGIALAIVPVGAELGVEARAAMGGLATRGRTAVFMLDEPAARTAQALEKEAMAGGRAALRRMSRAEIHLERVLQQGIVERFAVELAENWLIEKLVNAALDPILKRLNEEWGATGPIGGLERAMERMLAQMPRERIVSTELPPAPPRVMP